MPIPATHRVADDQRRAMRQASAMQGESMGTNTIVTQDTPEEVRYVIFVYNLLDRAYEVNQPPLFPGFKIPACPKGEKFSYTVLPAFVNVPFNHPGTTEYYYKREDGRKSATSLLNPAAFPGTQWEGQLANWDSLDQSGNNLNALGVFWSLTAPDEEEKLDQEIKIFQKRVNETMNTLIRRAEELAAQGELRMISPLMHFAMDYLGKQAGWHMTHDHMITCPNCGDPVKEGIAYHRNSFGDKCIIDMERCIKLGIVSTPINKVEPRAAVPQAEGAVENENETAVEEKSEPVRKAPKKGQRKA